MWKRSLLALSLMSLAGVASAHFGVVVPDHAMVVHQLKKPLVLDISFSHPMERNGMTMAKPKSVQVFVDGKATNLTKDLKPAKRFGKESWKLDFPVKRPGVYQFVVTPQPYWEPAEDKFIVHYSKVEVPAYGGDEGWDVPTGVKTEIVPLTRPFGNYAGNTFQGQLLVDGKPVANADVEIEYMNDKADREAPNEYYITQVIKTDPNGVFTYSVPWGGWWGFSALTTATYKLKAPNGQEKPVEQGAVFWSYFAPVKK